MELSSKNATSNQRCHTFEPEDSLDTQEPIIEPESALSTSWYKEAVFYEVYVRAFFDSNGDGIGDIPGLTAKLDYLYSLGINCIWLLPIYPSPLKDDGYDVSDYYSVHPDYGTLADFKVLVRSVHERNMRIIMDFIPNHTSDQHEWFKQSRSSKTNPYRNWYVWAKEKSKYDKARIIFLDSEKSNWEYDPKTEEYYWHRFYRSQPDLNFDNPEVREEMKNVMRFWLAIGIDGFRVDAVPYLFEEEGTNCENLETTHQYLKDLRIMMDTEFPGRVLLAEACQLPQDVIKYFGNNGDEFHMGFHFPVMPRIYISVMAQNYSNLKKILEETPEIPTNCQWVTFLRNHDELTLEMVSHEERWFMWENYAPDSRMRINLGIRRRLAPLLGNDRRKIELVHSMLLTLPGSPILYYGDEICMGDNIWLDDRNGVRTPMQWDPTPQGGFSRSAKTYAPVITEGEHDTAHVNVADTLRDCFSFYHILRHMVWVRRKHPALGRGKLVWIDAENMKTKAPELSVAAWVRWFGMDKVLIVHNLSDKLKMVRLSVPIKLLNFNLGFCEDILSGMEYEITKNSHVGTFSIGLEPYQSRWINLTSPTFCGEKFSGVGWSLDSIVAVAEAE